MLRTIFGVMTVVLLSSLVGCAPCTDARVRPEGPVYAFGAVVVYEAERQIRFPAVVRQEKGWVQHLIHLRGYHWLTEKSAFVSIANLADLQKGIATLDWKLWDSLWQGFDTTATEAMSLYIVYDGRKLPARSFVQAEETLHAGDFIFFGCPYFDVVALAASAAVDCSLCPIYPLERKALGDRFVRDSGISGFTLRTESMPLQNTEVEVLIILP